MFRKLWDLIADEEEAASGFTVISSIVLTCVVLTIMVIV